MSELASTAQKIKDLYEKIEDIKKEINKLTVDISSSNIDLNTEFAIQKISTNIIFQKPESTDGTKGIQGMFGNNDGWRIVGRTTPTNTGNLEIATMSNGTEPIYVRQYMGNNYNSIKKEAILLDNNGNTFFPGQLSVNSLKISTPRKIYNNIFDGTKDITIQSEVSGIAIENGNIVKANSKGDLLAGELLKEARVYESKSDIPLLNKSVSMQEMFNDWKRVSWRSGMSDYSYQNRPEEASERASFIYDASTDCIVGKLNSVSTCLFVSSKKYSPSYTIDYLLDNTNSYVSSDADDDSLIFVVGYMIDTDGNFHYLSLVRNGGSQTVSAGTNWNNGWYLAYDAERRGSSLRLASVATKATNWQRHKCYCRVEKTTGKIIAKTSNVDNSTYSYTLEYTLPDTKPSGWTDEQYNNIKTMMTQKSSIGFGTQSQPGAFKVVNTTGSLAEILLYNLNTGQKELFNHNGTSPVSKAKDTEVLTSGSMIYNRLTKKLFYYKGIGDFIEIKL